AAPHLPRAARELEFPEERSDEGRLARAVRTGEGEALARLQLEVERAEAKRSSFHDGADEPSHGRREATAGVELEPELPGLERLLGKRVPLEQLLGLPHLRAECVRPPPVGAARLLAEARALGARLCPPGREERRELAATFAGMHIVRVRSMARLVATPGIVGPTACPLDDPVRAGVDLRDTPDSPIEERPVVRDQDDGPGEAVDERLELREPPRVEVIRRLVEEKEVGLHQEDTREGGPCRLAARERVEEPVEADTEPDPRARRRRARVEVAAAERQKPRECRVVAVGHRLCRITVRVAGESGGCGLELPLGGRDAGQPGQATAQRLAETTLGLLSE